MNYAHNDNHLFFDFFRIIKSYFFLILTIFLLVVGTAYLTANYAMTKVYAASTQIQVQKQDRDLEIFDRSDPISFDPVFFQTQIDIIRSKIVLEKVIAELGLQKAWAREVNGMTKDLTVEQAYNRLLRNHLVLDNKRGTMIIDIRALSEDKKLAENIANTVAKVYLEHRLQTETAKQNRGLQNLEKIVENQTELVKKSREKVEELRKTLGIDAVYGGRNESQLNDIELQRKATMLDEVRSDMIGRRVRLEELEKLNFERLMEALPALGLEDPNLSATRQQMMQTDAELSRLRKSGLGDEHPKVQSLSASAETLREQVKSLVEGKRAALAIDLAVSKERVLQLEKEVAELKNLVRSEKTEKMAPFIEASDELERQQNMLNSLMIRFNQQKADAKQVNDPAIILSVAKAGDLPVKPYYTSIYGLAVGLGLFLGVGAAFLLEYLDTSMKSMKDVQNYLGSPVLAIIPDGVAPLQNEDRYSPHAEGYRILRAKIDINTKKHEGALTLTMVSGAPGEGKSTTLFNLGFVSAQAGKSVLIIDTDLRRPSLHKILGIENGPGFSDLLQGRGEIFDYISATETPNLHVITAGEMPEQLFGIFSAQRLRHILSSLRGHFDMILLDSPPIIGVSDASVICHEVDATILVVQHRRYPREVTLQAKQAIEEVKGNLMGVVLNAVKVRTQKAGYYSGYDYAYPVRNGKENGLSKITLSNRNLIAMDNVKSDSSAY